MHWSRGECLPKGVVCLGVSAQGVSAQGGVYPGDVCPGVSAGRGCLTGGQQTPQDQSQTHTPRHQIDTNPDTMGYGQQVGGAHSTGMNSCLLNASFSSVIHESLQELGINMI